VTLSDKYSSVSDKMMKGMKLKIEERHPINSRFLSGKLGQYSKLRIWQGHPISQRDRQGK